MTLQEAIQTLYEARRDRIVNPVGKFDRAGRWWPSNEEDLDNYTARIRPPSRNHKYSYMAAARSLKHIKALAQVRPDLVLAWADEAVATRQRIRNAMLVIARQAQ